MAGAHKILIVEDNDFVRMQLVRFLSDEGYEVLESSDGTAGLEKMGPDIALAIVDVRMEPMGGFEFVRHIRSINLETPVVFVTGDQNPDLLAETGKWNISAVLMKPVQKERLSKTVLRILQHKSRVS